MRNQLFLWILTTLLISSSLSCSTRPPKTDLGPVENLQKYSGKIKIKNLQKKTQQTISFHSWVANPDFMRMDAEGPLGILVGQLFWDGQNLTAFNHHQKKVYLGDSQTGSIKRLVGLDLSPRVLSFIMAAKPLVGDSWSCKKQAEDQIDICENRQDQLQVQYVDKTNFQHRVLIKSPQMSLNMVVKVIETKVQDPASVFSFEIPKSYKRFEVKK